MRKILITISLIIFGLINTSNLAFALNQAGSLCKQNTDCDQKKGLFCNVGEFEFGTQPDSATGRCRNTIDVLTQRPNADKPNPDIKSVQNLPSITLESGIAVTIKAMLRSAMLLVIIAIVVAAIYYIISRGKEEDLTKAKDIILYLVIGLAIIAAAYGIVAGITQFNIFG